MESALIELMEMCEWIEALTTPTILLFWIQGILALVEFRPLFWIGENFFRCCNIDKFLFRDLLIIAVWVIVRMPFLRSFSVRFDYFWFRRGSFNPQDFVVISLRCLFLEFLSTLHPFLGATVVLVEFQGATVVFKGYDYEIL